jgi:aspartyl protease family protein
MLFDTGARYVAISRSVANWIGIEIPDADFTTSITTAGAPTFAVLIKIGELRIGSILLRDVETLVFRDGTSELNLLGMSALNQISFGYKAGLLVIKP